MKKLEKEKKVIQMKKKLLAMILSVVMLTALLVPVLAASAAAPTLGIGLGTPVLETKSNGDQVIVVPVKLTANDGQLFALRYQVVSTSGLEPYTNVAAWDYGWIAGDVTQAQGPFTAKFANTVNTDAVVDGNKGFQVVQDAIEGAPGAGIATATGTLITVYFKAPTTVGTYNFEVIWMDGTDNTKTKYTANVGDSVAYVKECTSHTKGEPEVTKEAKCGVAGEEVVKCTACGKVIETNEIKALEHAWDNGTAAEGVACGNTADVTYKCTREGCGETKVETGAKVEHDWVEDTEAYVAPKCGVAGKKVYKCSNENCTVKTKEEAVKALEHAWDNGTADASKVCGETADVTYKCTREGCDGSRVETGAKIEHDWAEDKDAYVAPKCGVAGKKVYVCQRANCPVATKEEPVAALEHVWGEYELTKAPTADAEGEKTAACQNEGCDEVDVIKVAKLDKEIEYKENGKVIASFKSEDAVLPEDITIDSKGAEKDEETGKITETLVFASDLVDLEGEVEFTINTALAGKFDNFEVFVKDAATGELTAVEFKFEKGMLTFNADLDGEYVLTYKEVKTSPSTGDASNVVVFAVIALISVAALVVVGKKRFAL